MDEIRNPHVAPPSDALRTYAAEMIARFGVRRAAMELGITRHAVTAVAAGARVHAGTRLQVLEAMRARGVEV